MAQTRCRKCLLNQDSGELYQSIQELIASLPAQDKANPEEYRMCLSCGCFVQVRGAKEKEHCPWDKW